MANFDDNWQKKRPSISERIKFIFHNELLSDVKFVAPVWPNKRESGKTKKTIPAHKFVLAISSPVFYAMFYGKLSEAADTVELSDCDYESLLEFFRYLYSNEVNLSVKNVSKILYLAKNYMVPSLADKCTEYLRDPEHLDASNVFSILPQAQKFGDKDLEERCWDVIEIHTGKALTSEEFLMVERSIVKSLVKRKVLNVREVDLFKAVDRWAAKEVERQGFTPDRGVKRRVLGEEIVKAIRLPLISLNDFFSPEFCSDILTKAEICAMVKRYWKIRLAEVPFSLPFVYFPRTCSIQRFYRFGKVNPPVTPDPTESIAFPYGLPLLYSDDTLRLSVNKPVRLHGIQHFGAKCMEYNVSLEVKDAVKGVSLVKHTESYLSKKDDLYAYYGFDVMFVLPVCLEQDRTYEIVSRRRRLLHVSMGPTWYGEEGKEFDEFQGIRFSSSGSNVSGGQFPSILFCSR